MTEEQDKQAAADTAKGSAPGLFIAIVVTAMIGAAVFGLRSNGVFACQSHPPDSDYYLAYCQATGFGDYDHGAFWFGLEQEAIAAAADADVLFLGNSRMQFALSGKELNRWFEQRGVEHYLLGFSHMENQLFAGPLLGRIEPRARTYVVNVDYFFEDRMSPPTRDIMTDDETPTRYQEKKRWLAAHSRLCGALPWLCRSEVAFYRDRDSGSWIRIGGDFAGRHRSVSYDETTDDEMVDRYVAAARELIDTRLGNDACIILTNTPQSGTSFGTAAALAKKLQLPFVAPRLDGLETFDGSHLNVDSAERWSAALIELLEPDLNRCLAG